MWNAPADPIEADQLTVVVYRAGRPRSGCLLRYIFNQNPRLEWRSNNEMFSLHLTDAILDTSYCLCNLTRAHQSSNLILFETSRAG